MTQRVVAIVQARLGSTRLPRKVLADIGGRPMLAHVLERAGGIHGVDAVVLTVPFQDAATILDAVRIGRISTGPEDDVLHRFMSAATQERAGVIIRITGDCPLLNAAMASTMLRHFLTLSAPHYYMTNRGPRHDGWDVEIFTRTALEAADVNSLPEQREHVTPWLYESESARAGVFEWHGREIPNGEKWSVDDEADLALVRRRYAEGW